MKNNLRIVFSIFVLGFTGVLSLLSLEIPLDNIPPEVLEKISPQQLRWLMLVNPSLLLLLACLAGTFTFRKLDFKVYFFNFVGTHTAPPAFWKKDIFYSIAWGIVLGIGILSISVVFSSIVPDEFFKMKSVNPPILTRIFYGGITEEILLRFGLMGLFTWFGFRIFHTKANFIYISSILLSSFIFALAHFPIVYQVLQKPSLLILIYILIGNSIGGIVFGTLYWRKGLEMAFIAHIFTHLTMVLIENTMT